MRSLFILFILVCGFAVTACKPNGASAPAATTTAVVKDAVPGKIEISAVDLTMLEDSARFKVHYKFLEGSPSKYYMCTFEFPGTTKKGLKPLDAWEMKPEGVIVAGVELGPEKLTEFTVHLAEADSPDAGYRDNSNVFAGKIEHAGQ